MGYELINIFEKVRDQFVVVAVTLSSENTYGFYRTELGLASFNNEMCALFTARDQYLNRKRKSVTDVDNSVDYLLYNAGSLDIDHPIKEALLELDVYYVDHEGTIYDVTIDRSVDGLFTFSKSRIINEGNTKKARLYLQGMVRHDDSSNEMKHTIVDIDVTQLPELSSTVTNTYFRWVVTKVTTTNQDGKVRKKRANAREVKREESRLSQLELEYVKFMEKMNRLGIKFNTKKDDRFSYVCVEFGTYVDENGYVYEIQISRDI